MVVLYKEIVWQDSSTLTVKVMTKTSKPQWPLAVHVEAADVWSNDRYESAEHRVSVNSARERFSLPYFFSPASYTIVKPVEELVSEDDPPKYNPYKWGEFLSARKNSNFRKLNVENVQITHFKKSLVT